MQSLSIQIVVVLAALLACISAQRPFYASGNSYPGVLPQYLPSSTTGGSADVDNRFNGDTTPNPYAAFEKDPKYNVEKELVDRIQEYPKDKQPYWYINAEQLNSFKGRPQQNVRKIRPNTSK